MVTASCTRWRVSWLARLFAAGWARQPWPKCVRDSSARRRRMRAWSHRQPVSRSCECGTRFALSLSADFDGWGGRGLAFGSLMTAPSLIPVTAGHERKRKGAFFRDRLEWLLSSEHFHLKLLFGTGVGVLVIVLLAATCFVLTFRSQRQAALRAHLIDAMRLTSVIGNDIAALENEHRGYLLTKESAYLENFQRCKIAFQKHSEEITAVLLQDSGQRKRILRMREIVWSWADARLAATPSSRIRLPSEPGQTNAALGAPQLDEAREILNSIQRE